MMRGFDVKCGLFGLALLAPLSAQAQSITPGANRNAPLPGVLTPAGPSGAGGGEGAGGGVKHSHAEIKRKGRTGYDIFLGTYLTLSADCKIGASPEITFSEPPRNGTAKIRTYPINLRDVPGAARRNCIGVSPRGVAAIYQSRARFKGEESVNFKVTYPNGDVREVSAKILVQ